MFLSSQSIVRINYDLSPVWFEFYAMNKLVFYTTLGCHLCEEAELLLRHLVSVEAVEVEAVDISSTPELVALYSIRSPVVKNLVTENELGWPFDYEELRRVAGASEDSEFLHE